MTIPDSAICPLPDSGGGDIITLAHGEGGRLMRRLIRERIVHAVENETLLQMGDAAQLPAVDGSLAMSTDSFVISPLFFPGGDIGSLAIYGTTNDLAVSGARPLWISLGLILEEGLPLKTLDLILQSIAEASRQVGVQVVTGDTKVVPRGAADQLFINTTGIGQIEKLSARPRQLQLGDEILVSGPIAKHGMAVMAIRESLAFDPVPTSDSGSLVDAAAALWAADLQVRAMRDATRGGVAAVLHEWSESCGLTISVEESRIPVTPEIRGVCEVLGLDPLHVANEGTMVVSVPGDSAAAALEVLRKFPQTSDAVRIGQVVQRKSALVVVRRALGREMPLDEPIGAPLPRIC
jgi:hydrogenase expression/formation protein HypE